MKNFKLVFISLIIASCSFDNKTGIWKDASTIPVENKNTELVKADNSNIRYVDVFVEKENFNEERNSVKKSILNLDDPVKLVNWPEEFGNPTNNISNYLYTGNKILVSKSFKLNKFFRNKQHFNNIIFYNNNLISYDHKGKIFIYSLNLKKKIFEYDFYKKNFKNFKKEIYFLLNENTLYAADNLGYLYAINLKKNSLLWAKNYGIPFRSNLKINKEQIFVANQDNVIYSINKNNGEKNWQFATNTTILKSNFKNNLALDQINNNVIFLNTSGELYSINYLNKKINWIINFKNSRTKLNTELFLSHPIVLKKNNIIISAGNSLLSFDVSTGSRNWEFLSNSITKPILTTDHTFIISKNNLLICVDNKTGDVVWSKNILKYIMNRKQNIKFNDFKIVNSKINIFLNDGYLLTFNHNNGNHNFSTKISKKGINSKIIFLNGNMFLFNYSNKLLKFN